MRQTKTARRYAQALKDLAHERKVIDRVFADMTAILDLVQATPELQVFFANPVIKNETKKATVKSIFGSIVGPDTMSFLLLLCDRNRENLLEEIGESFIDMRNEELGVVKTDVFSVVDLTDVQVKELQKRVVSMTGKTPKFNFKKDPSLIGGFKVRIGDTVIDGSVRHQLEKLRERFVEESINER